MLLVKLVVRSILVEILRLTLALNFLKRNHRPFHALFSTVDVQLKPKLVFLVNKIGLTDMLAYRIYQKVNNYLILVLNCEPL